MTSRWRSDLFYFTSTLESIITCSAVPPMPSKHTPSPLRPPYTRYPECYPVKGYSTTLGVRTWLAFCLSCVVLGCKSSCKGAYSCSYRCCFCSCYRCNTKRGSALRGSTESMMNLNIAKRFLNINRDTERHTPSNNCQLLRTSQMNHIYIILLIKKIYAMRSNSSASHFLTITNDSAR